MHHPKPLSQVKNPITKLTLPPARAALGVAPLQWDTNLQAAAQNWANHLAQVNSLDHDPNAGAGENIALFSPANNTILANATALWLAEKSAYTYGIFDGSQVEAAGHYTQVR